MDKAHLGLRRALETGWRGGVTCRVTRSGEAAVGCDVALTRNLLRQFSWIVYLDCRRFYKAGRRMAGSVARRLGLKR
jgi:hypothetical protein